jgi:hypothetical protein
MATYRVDIDEPGLALPGAWCGRPGHADYAGPRPSPAVRSQASCSAL